LIFVFVFQSCQKDEEIFSDDFTGDVLDRGGDRNNNGPGRGGGGNNGGGAVENLD